MTAEAKDTVIASLKETFEEEEGEIETLCDILTNGLVSDEILLLCALGSASMGEKSKTKNVGRQIYKPLAMNFKMCISEAFPACEVVDHPTQCRRMGKKFHGFGFCGIKRQPPPPGDEPRLPL